MKGPLAAAILDFENELHSPPAEPEIHEVVTSSIFFGPIVFSGVIYPDCAEVKDFENDPRYWELIDPDPAE